MHVLRRESIARANGLASKLYWNNTNKKACDKQSPVQTVGHSRLKRVTNAVKIVK